MQEEKTTTMQHEEERMLAEQPKERQTSSEVNIAIDEGVASSKLLEYELTVFTDLQAEDGLVITAKYVILTLIYLATMIALQ